jgi:hypothetical protein
MIYEYTCHRKKSSIFITYSSGKYHSSDFPVTSHRCRRVKWGRDAFGLQNQRSITYVICPSSWLTILKKWPWTSIPYYSVVIRLLITQPMLSTLRDECACLRLASHWCTVPLPSRLPCRYFTRTVQPSDRPYDQVGLSDNLTITTQKMQAYLSRVGLGRGLRIPS